METILVTGGCGFIGRYVVEELLQHGYVVTVLDALIGQVHGGASVDASRDVRLIRGDVRDRALLNEALEDADGIIHLAAEVGVGQSMYEIDRYVGANDLGTATILQALIDRPVRRIVVASSMSVYGEGRYVCDGKPCGLVRRTPEHVKKGQWEPVGPEGRRLQPVATDEEKPVDLNSIYALTKFVQEQQCLIFGNAYPTEVVALRLFNVFGAGQALSNPYTGVLANFAARLANKAAPMIFEDGNQRRDFVHVKDVALAFRLAYEKTAAAGHVINIGSGRSYAIAQVASILASAMGVPDLKPEILGRARAGDIRHCFADISKAQALLGFEPRYDLPKSIEAFVQWVRENDAIDRGPEMRRQLEERGLVS